jgi:hypothetical protein
MPQIHPQYKHLKIGPALGEGPLIERPADVLKVWPRRELIQRQAVPLPRRPAGLTLPTGASQKRQIPGGSGDSVP